MTRRTAPAVLGGLLLALGALGCGPGEDCKQLCGTLVDDCGLRAWTSDELCAEGCDDELFRHPQRGPVIGCYQDAADACDVEALIECRHLGVRLAVEPDEE